MSMQSAEQAVETVPSPARASARGDSRWLVEHAERKEPSLNGAVQQIMKVITRAVLVIALGLSGCASTPLPVQPRVAAWPASVAETCPRRTVLLECFRKPSIRAAMRRLIEPFRACRLPGAEPVKVMLTIETRGGAPSCVDRSPRSGEAARCLAKAVARHLVIPNSRPDEACSFRYPVWLQTAPTSGGPTTSGWE